MDKFVLIDGNNLFFRAFYALPQLANSHGEISNAVFGFANMIIKVIDEYKPKYMAVAFDTSEPTFRHKLFTDYKGQRDPAPSELLAQFPIAKKMLEAMKIKSIEIPGIEADDIIGTLSRKFDVQNIVVSADKDLLQLINNNTFVFAPKKGISETMVYNVDTLMENMKVTPSQIIDLKSLMGDASDNIPGVAGVGVKTATDLIEKYGSLDGVYQNIDNIKGKLQEKLVNGKDMAYLSYTLATIKCDVKLDYNLQDFTYEYPFGSGVYELFARYQFHSLLKRKEIFRDDAKLPTQKDTCRQVEIKDLSICDKIIDECQDSKFLSLFVGENISVYTGKTEYHLPKQIDLFNTISQKDVLEKLVGLIENKDIDKYVFDYKKLLHTFDNNNISVSFNGTIYDLMIMRYLYNMNAKAVTQFEQIALEEDTGLEVPSYSIYNLSKKYWAKLKDYDLIDLYQDIELPLSVVLFDMEKNGFAIDKDVLQSLKEKYEHNIDTLQKEIYELAGKEFNINSPKQLADVLFLDLGINMAGRNKKMSTKQDILKEIEGMHPIVAKIIDYRKQYKLYSTYIIAMEGLIGKDNKIHTVFNQTLTTTGRLSSSEPNLQNIPVRTDEGRNIRKMFVPSSKNGYIISSDYSQIELRLLAHLSNDSALIKSFNNNEDIHTMTASRVFGVPQDEVTHEMRRDAKAINFGIVYGISDYGLSQNIGSSVKRAKDYIEKYFLEHPAVKQYMDDNVMYCKEYGYVKTMFNRIRVIPEIKSSNYNLRQFGERASMNMPLQGTASDIIKLAMIKVYQAFNENHLKSKLILQVHDELVCDVVENEKDVVQKILKDCMENVVKLSVPLNVNISCGHNWYDAD